MSMDSNQIWQGLIASALAALAYLVIQANAQTATNKESIDMLKGDTADRYPAGRAAKDYKQHEDWLGAHSVRLDYLSDQLGHMRGEIGELRGQLRCQKE